MNKQHVKWLVLISGIIIILIIASAVFFLNSNKSKSELDGAMNSAFECIKKCPLDSFGDCLQTCQEVFFPKNMPEDFNENPTKYLSTETVSKLVCMDSCDSSSTFSSCTSSCNYDAVCSESCQNKLYFQCMPNCLK